MLDLNRSGFLSVLFNILCLWLLVQSSIPTCSSWLCYQHEVVQTAFRSEWWWYDSDLLWSRLFWEICFYHQ